MSKDSSAKYYQGNKESLQKNLLKDIKVFLKKRKKKSEHYKKLPEDKKQRLVEYRKKYYRMTKNV